ncbi:hypothetical protein CcrJ4_gp070c [Caulobacter phage J4]|nr:hypothetical protein CcrJ4_gp070c [Caulobacter phage J4]UTU09373.1 hypothetical protein CcrBL47_gp087c [Caulobacter phage BL47]UTU09933.1 hypothetical protein CcrRB23_gp071c [Caulobacter phage RB23]
MMVFAELHYPTRGVKLWPTEYSLGPMPEGHALSLRIGEEISFHAMGGDFDGHRLEAGGYVGRIIDLAKTVITTPFETKNGQKGWEGFVSSVDIKVLITHRPGDPTE